MTAIVTTTRTIDLAQLASEVDCDALSARTADGSTTVTCHAGSLTNAQLQAAVDAHTPAPPPLTATQLLQAQIDELTDLMMGAL